jgi:hypothetical protein
VEVEVVCWNWPSEPVLGPWELAEHAWEGDGTSKEQSWERKSNFINFRAYFWVFLKNPPNFSLSLSLFISFFLYFLSNLSIYLSIYLAIYLYVSSIDLSICIDLSSRSPLISNLPIKTDRSTILRALFWYLRACLSIYACLICATCTDLHIMQLHYPCICAKWCTLPDIAQSMHLCKLMQLNDMCIILHIMQLHKQCILCKIMQLA